MQPTDPVQHDEPGAGREMSRPPQGRSADSSPLDRSLTGDLPCVRCGYSLRGLSIRSDCPECGTPVRAAILAVVDPHASELQPIRHPGLVAGGLILWTGAALAAAVLAWVPQIVELWSTALSSRVAHPDVSVPIVVCILLSAAGATAIIHPHPGLGRWRILAASGSVLLYIPLALVMWRLCRTSYTGAITDYIRGMIAVPEHVWLRLGADALIVLIALGLRFNARVLVARSLALRQGRVDRQTLAAIAVAAGVAAAGDLIGLLASEPTGAIGEVAALAAIGLVATGSALLTLGLAGALLDSIRIVSSLRVPGPTLRDLVTPRTGPAAVASVGGGSGGSRGSGGGGGDEGRSGE